VNQTPQTRLEQAMHVVSPVIEPKTGVIHAFSIRRLSALAESTLRSPNQQGVSVTDVLGKSDELTQLTAAAEDLVQTMRNDVPAAVTDRAALLLERLRQRRFDVAVVGEFNRGKSTLINTLLERDVLPAGALPVTSIPTQLVHGDESARVKYLDGHDQVIDLNDLERYVTEETNPNNTMGVDAVEVTVPSEMLKHGAVLVDTPGLNSIFRQSSEAAREEIVQADGAVVVLSADAPLTDAERSLLRLLRRRSARTFFVLNRIDLLTPEELEKVRWYVGNALLQISGEEQEIYGVSAKTGEGMDEFAAALGQFLADGLDSARLEVARKDVIALADGVDNECALEEAALAMSVEEAEERIQSFRVASESQGEAFADDNAIFEHAVDRLIARVYATVTPMEQVQLQSAVRRIEATLENTPASELVGTAEELVEAEVSNHLEPIRREQDKEIDAGWRQAAERFSRAAERRNKKVRDAAGSLFEVNLKAIPIAGAGKPAAKFSYSSPVNMQSPGGRLDRILGPLMGERRNRAKVVAAAEKRLRNESQRNAQLIIDSAQRRLVEAMHKLQDAMEAQVQESTQVMERVVKTVEQSRDMVGEQSAEHAAKADRLRHAAERARTAASRS